MDVWRGMNQGVNILGNLARFDMQDKQNKHRNALEDKRMDLATNQDQRVATASQQNTEKHDLGKKLQELQNTEAKLKLSQSLMGQIRDENSFQWAKPQLLELFPHLGDRIGDNFDPEKLKQGLYGSQQALAKIQAHKNAMELEQEKGKQTRLTNAEKPNKRLPAAETTRQQKLALQHLIGFAQQSGLNVGKGMDGKISGTMNSEQLIQLTSAAKQQGFKVYTREGEVDKDWNPFTTSGDVQMHDIIDIIPMTNQDNKPVGNPGTVQYYMDKYAGGKTETPKETPKKEPKKNKQKKKSSKPKTEGTPVLTKIPGESRFDKIKRGAGYAKEATKNALDINPERFKRQRETLTEEEKRLLKLAGQ